MKIIESEITVEIDDILYFSSNAHHCVRVSVRSDARRNYFET